MVERYGVEYLAHDESRKEAMVKGLRKYVSGKKHTIESLKIIFEEQGCKLLSDEYKDNKGKLSVLFACGCQGDTSYNKFSKGQRCSTKECVNAKKKSTVKQRFGVENYQVTEECKNRVKETNLKKYGVEYYRQTQECEDRIQNFNQDKYGLSFYFQTDKFKEKAKKKCMDDFNVEYYTQTNEFKNKAISTNMIRYGFPIASQNENIKNKIIQTNIERFGQPYALMNVEIREKANKTIMSIYGVDNISQNEGIKNKKMITSQTRYGVDHPSQLESVKNKHIETSQIRYGVNNPMQNSEIFDRAQEAAYQLKLYTFPNGRTEYIQGYEGFAIDYLCTIYDIDDIVTSRSEIPEFWYHGYDGKYHRYYPDIHVAKDNLIIEVKSIWTYTKDKLKIRVTSKAVKYNGYKYCLMVFDPKGDLLPMSVL
jgi:hypothetical protein